MAWFRFARWTCSCRSSPSAMWCWSPTISRSSPTPSSRSTSSRPGVCSTITMVQHQTSKTSCISSIKFVIRGAWKRFEDGNSIQEAADQWAHDHVSPVCPPSSDFLCHCIFQTILLWSCCDREPVSTTRDNHTVCQASTDPFIEFQINFKNFSVMEKLPATSYVRMVDIWLIFGQLIPFIQVEPPSCIWENKVSHKSFWLKVVLFTIIELYNEGDSTINHHGFARNVLDKKRIRYA